MEDASRFTFMGFSHQLLEKTRIKDVIYHLQHESGFNINLILYLLWTANTQHGRLSKHQIKQLQLHIASWHQRVITELKYTHALVAGHSVPVTTQLKEMLEEEIVKAFLIEQHMLYESGIRNALTLRNYQQQLTDACASFMHYCELRNEILVEEDYKAFIQLLLATFPDLQYSEVEHQVSTIFKRFNNAPQQPTQHVLWNSPHE